jgi:hypothetical protein
MEKSSSREALTFDALIFVFVFVFSLILSIC